MPRMSSSRSAWSGAAAYAASFARLCAGSVEALLDASDPSGTLLDVGTGPGTVVRRALERGWDARGVDPSPEMLRLAATAVPVERLLRAELPVLPFADASFDAVTANFVVNHLSDPRAGVRELARVAEPTGTIALTIWPSPVSAMNELWNRMMERAGTRPAVGSRLPPEADFERTSEGLSRLCRESGLVVELAAELRWIFSIDPSDLWLGVEGGIGVIGQTYLASTSSGRERLARAYDDLAEPGSDGQLHLDTVAVLAVGRPGR